MVATQAEFFFASTERIMDTADFRRGVEEVRAGKPPDFDATDIDDAWNYERGRQWAMIAPRGLPLFVDGEVNPLAIALYDKAYQRKWITNEHD
jgi:hypothetical protein